MQAKTLAALQDARTKRRAVTLATRLSDAAEALVYLDTADGALAGDAAIFSRFGKPNFILGWIASVDSEISIIDLLGVDCRERREKESKQKRTNPVHKI